LNRVSHTHCVDGTDTSTYPLQDGPGWVGEQFDTNSDLTYLQARS
jgi:hypothetical protein